MLSKEDIQNLIKAQQEIFATKGDLAALKDDLKEELKTELKSELIEVFATREEVATKKDIDDLRNDFSILQVSVDGYAKKADTYFKEMAALAHKVNRHEEWLKQIAEKVGMKLEY